jgi:hypothetical protein
MIRLADLIGRSPAPALRNFLGSPAAGAVPVVVADDGSESSFAPDTACRDLSRDFPRGDPPWPRCFVEMSGPSTVPSASCSVQAGRRHDVSISGPAPGAASIRARLRPRGLLRHEPVPEPRCTMRKEPPRRTSQPIARRPDAATEAPPIPPPREPSPPAPQAGTAGPGGGQPPDADDAPTRHSWMRLEVPT